MTIRARKVYGPTFSRWGESCSIFSVFLLHFRIIRAILNACSVLATIVNYCLVSIYMYTVHAEQPLTSAARRRDRYYDVAWGQNKGHIWLMCDAQ